MSAGTEVWVHSFSSFYHVSARFATYYEDLGYD